jgi:hypothetical protein
VRGLARRGGWSRIGACDVGFVARHARCMVVPPHVGGRKTGMSKRAVVKAGRGHDGTSGYAELKRRPHAPIWDSNWDK